MHFSRGLNWTSIEVAATICAFAIITLLNRPCRSVFGVLATGPAALGVYYMYAVAPRSAALPAMQRHHATLIKVKPLFIDGMGIRSVFAHRF